MPPHDGVICGDSREVLKTLDDASVDSVCTDPPYALSSSRNGTTGFMGAHWDTGQVAHDPAFWAEVLRVARPGAFLLAFGGCRTYHRLVCAIEDAGWEIRDQIVHWIYGSGFPKSTSCLKPSQEPIVLAKAPGPLQPLHIDACRVATGEGTTRRNRAEMGYGGGNLAAEYTTGSDRGRWPSNLALSHIGGPDGCQPAGVRRVRGSNGVRGSDAGNTMYGGGQGLRRPTTGQQVGYADADGRETVSAYHCVEGCPVAALDEQAGPRTSGKGGGRSWGASGGTHQGWKRPAHAQYQPKAPDAYYGDSGNASRFFPVFPPETPDPEDAVPFRYCSKASRRDRNAGLEGRPKGFLATMNDGIGAREHNPEQPTPWAANDHPTCKPTALMAWLCKLVTPPGGTVLDCFAGSGSTLVACVREGFGFIGIEQDSHYCDIARGRIAHARAQLAGPLFAAAEKDA